MLHLNILCSLAVLNLPTCAINKSFLTRWCMCVWYNGAESDFKKCPGGGPQGGLLACVFFIMQVYKVGSSCTLTRLVLPILGRPASRNIIVMNTNHHETEDQSELPSLRKDDVIPQLCHNQDKLHKKSYIDDLTLLENISLSDLKQKRRIVGPLNYHDRFNLTLPPEKSTLQHQLQDLVHYTAQQSMVLN